MNISQVPLYPVGTLLVSHPHPLMSLSLSPRQISIENTKLLRSTQLMTCSLYGTGYHQLVA